MAMHMKTSFWKKGAFSASVPGRGKCIHRDEVGGVSHATLHQRQITGNKRRDSCYHE